MTHAGGWNSTGASGPRVFGPVRVWPMPAAGTLVIQADRHTAVEQSLDERAAKRWAELCSLNSRLHDGPIWSVTTFDPPSGTIGVRRDRYSRYAVRPALGRGVRMLAVRGVITAADANGIEHVLMGLRSPQTRVYGDLWEVLPGGGMPAEESTSEFPPLGAFVEHLRQEAREEAGLELDPGECEFAGVCDDSYAGGFDVLMTVRVKRTLEEVRAAMGDRDWEHRRVEWLAVPEVSGFDREQGARISPPTRAIFRSRGWVRDEG